MGSLFALPAVKAIESAFNRFLSLDPDSPDYLQPLLGRLVQIDVSGLGARLYFLFHHDRVEVMDDFDAAADVVIQGAPLSLTAMATGRIALMQSDVSLQGDIETAKRFSDLLKRVEIDWAEHISSLTGDQIAHSLGRVASGAGGWVRRFHSSMERNVADYLRDETNHLPHRWEIDEFCESVDELRDRVDGLLQRAEKGRHGLLDSGCTSDHAREDELKNSETGEYKGGENLAAKNSPGSC